MSEAQFQDDLTRRDLIATAADQPHDVRETVEVLAEEFAARLRSGEHPSISEYTARCPEHSKRIKEIFPYVAMMEQFQQTASDRLAEESDVNGGPIFEVQPNQPTLGDYVLLSKIGRGGMGRVFKARHRRMDRLVALKVLPPSVMKDTKAVDRFRREMKTTAKLFHPNIVTAFDAGEQDGVHYLVMEYVDGRVLSQVVQEHGALSPETAASYALQAARGLHYAHSREVIHRDVKPSNLICGEDGSIKVLDFGLARFDSAPALTASGTILGTVYYMSPEQITDACAVDFRSDIYSLGCTLFFLLTGQPPFTGTVSDAIRAHQAEPAPRLRDLRDEVPGHLEEIVRKCLVKHPAKRYQSMAELIADLEKSEGDGSVVLSSDPSSPRSVAVCTSSVGVDIGTSVSMIGRISANGEPVTVSDECGQCTMPSVVAINGHNIAVGADAFSGIGIPSDNVALDIKNSRRLVHFPDKLSSRYPREVLYALLLYKLVDQVRRKDGSFGHIAIAVPNCFSDVSRKAVMDAAYIAGLESIDLVNETLAAALFYSCQSSSLPPHGKTSVDTPSRDLLVVKLGAGDFAASLIRCGGGAVTVLATESHCSLGGQDFDSRLVDLVRDRIGAEQGLKLAQDRGTTWLLRQKCEMAKRTLSTKEKATIRLEFRGRSVSIEVDRAAFRKRARDLCDVMRESIERVRKEANAEWKGVDKVLLTGGGTRMPLVPAMIENLAGAGPPIERLSDDAVVRGATLYAQMHSLKRRGTKPELQVSDVSSSDIGVRVSDRPAGRDGNVLLIPRNTQLPATYKSFLVTPREGQGVATLRILQSRDAASEPFESLANCTIDGPDSTGPVGSKLPVEFKISASGRLTVRVESPATGHWAAKELTYPSGLSNVELSQWRDWVETMMLCSGLFVNNSPPKTQ